MLVRLASMLAGNTEHGSLAHLGSIWAERTGPSPSTPSQGCEHKGVCRGLFQFGCKIHCCRDFGLRRRPKSFASQSKKRGLPVNRNSEGSIKGQRAPLPPLDGRFAPTGGLLLRGSAAASTSFLRKSTTFGGSGLFQARRLSTNVRWEKEPVPCWVPPPAQSRISLRFFHSSRLYR